MFVIQWKPLNVITDNVIIQLMWSICLYLTKSQVAAIMYFISERGRLLFTSVNVITLGLAQSDHINRLPLYLSDRSDGAQPLSWSPGDGAVRAGAADGHLGLEGGHTLGNARGQSKLLAELNVGTSLSWKVKKSIK
jgi:hypothetical protein